MKALLLALAGSALLATTASAQLTYNDGDLLLDFRATSGTGASTNFEVDLGAADQAQFASGTVYVPSLLTTAQANELSSLFSGNSANVVWSVGGSNVGTLGGNYTNGSTLFITQGTSAPTPVLKSNVAVFGQAAQANVGSGASGFTATTVDSNSVTISQSDSNSYDSQLTATVGQYFSVPINNPEAAYNGGSLTLYAIQPDAAVDGANATTYKLATFTFSAVPEPSTYVLMLGGLLALVVLKRRSTGSIL
ncbi:MAG: PEP-CTERM sorting domain-containing protein [Methylacidiphilales bacterium]|nr:PEP-CTERM sorting domain-containing protein [Candidatus Methylacidiphilales bacterium]